MFKITTLLFLLSLTGAALSEPWTPSKHPWGDPDLQGTWTNATVTRLERSDNHTQLILTDAEVTAVELDAAGFQEDNDTLPEGDLEAGVGVGGYNSAWIDPGTRVLRVNDQPRSSIIVEPDNGKLPYRFSGRYDFFKELIKTQLRNNPEEQLLGDRCMVGFGSSGGPPMLPVLYNNNYQIVQSPGHVMIMVEMNHAARTIRIDGNALPHNITPWLGDSVGHWQGDTLVVKTRGFHPQQSLRAAIKHQLLMSTNSIVTERFTRTSETEINYQFTVEDDDIYSQPWSGEITLRPTDGQIYEYACHEGNYALPGILAGEREAGVDGIAWLINLLTEPQL
ncbi:MAG: hypothetical protein V7459_16135 [Oceanicoccus sp.]